MNVPLLSPREAVPVLALITAFSASAAEFVANGDFEDDGTNIAGATTEIDFWDVDVRGSGDYSFLTTIGNFQFTGNNLDPGVDLASFRQAGGASAAASGSYHIDMIGAAVGETNHNEQRLNSVINQSLTGLSIGQQYTLSFQYSTTSFVSQPREMGVRIDPETAGVIDDTNNIYSNLFEVRFLPTDPAGVLTQAQTEIFGPGGPLPFDYTTLPTDPEDLDFLSRTTNPNAVSATVDFDETAGSATEAPVLVNWQTVMINFTPTTTDVRLSFFNNTDPFAQDESEYHYRTAANVGGTHDIWFGNEVGLLLDNVSVTGIPEPGSGLLIGASALSLLFVRRRPRLSDRRPAHPANSVDAR